MNKEEQVLFGSIESIIQRYNLFNKEICVAYSGGKDSWFLCKALKELGYIVHALILDIGYEFDWTSTINKLKPLKIDAEIVKKDRIQDDDARKEIERNFEYVKSISFCTQYGKNTICTPCYNAKMIMLTSWAQLNKITCIATGHHATDAISSMLKSYYMYIDRWVFSHKEYTYENFEKLIKSQEFLYRDQVNNSIQIGLLEDIRNKILANKVGTDEPIKKYLINSNICICCPMFAIHEKQIVRYMKNNNYIYGMGECFLGYRKSGIYTPRELIQLLLLKKAPDELLEELINIVKMGLNEDGTLKFNFRNNRSEILGKTYKETFINKLKI